MNSIIKTTILSIAIGIIALSIGCKKRRNPNYGVGHFPTTPVNMYFLNTIHDDYNSALKQSGEVFPLCFSSNRKSAGKNFDIVYFLMSIRYDWDSGELDIGLENSGNLGVELNNNNIYHALDKINTSSDEFGPFMVPMDLRQDPNPQGWGTYYSYLFLFSNNESGNQDIRFVENTQQIEYTDAKPVTFLNSNYDDAYPSFNEQDSGLYFCSNRFGNFDILFANIDFQSKDWPAIFSDTTAKKIQKVEVLSSDSADKCPFILNNTLVFASNRPGGYGGFDLYYSKFQNGKWSNPKNFGPSINTAADEYRPVIRHEDGFDNDFMIFSSNRSGGKGGFDLYYVGVDIAR